MLIATTEFKTHDVILAEIPALKAAAGFGVSDEAVFTAECEQLMQCFLSTVDVAVQVRPQWQGISA